MHYSKQAIEKYNSLLKKEQGIRSWKAFIHDITDGWVLSEPCLTGEILEEIEAKLMLKLPSELKELYSETDGIKDTTLIPIVYPAKDLVKENLVMRDTDDFRELYMPFDHLFFFGTCGNGDLYAYPITMDGKVDFHNVFVWDHENDSRKWIAMGIRDLVLRILSDLMD